MIKTIKCTQNAVWSSSQQSINYQWIRLCISLQFIPSGVGPEDRRILWHFEMQETKAKRRNNSSDGWIEVPCAICDNTLKTFSQPQVTLLGDLKLVLIENLLETTIIPDYLNLWKKFCGVTCKIRIDSIFIPENPPTLKFRGWPFWLNL